MLHLRMPVILTASLPASFLWACAYGAASPTPKTADVSSQDWAQGCEPWDDWNAPASPYRITARTSYVGTCGITALLVETDDGLVLFDTGTEAGSEVVLANIEALGHMPGDVALILTSHEHLDHVGGLAKVVAATGAEVVAGQDAASVLTSGEDDPRDPQAGMHDPMAPVADVCVLDDSGTVTRGGVEFRMITTPGHTPGAVSWSWRDCADGLCRDMVYADSLSPVSRDGYRFSDYPDYVASYRAGLARLEALPCDVLLTPHPSSSSMVRRAEAGAFEDSDACKTYAAKVSARLDRRLAEEALSPR